MTTVNDSRQVTLVLSTNEHDPAEVRDLALRLCDELRSQWPPLYEQLLAHLRTTTAAQSTQQAESQAIRHFIQILLLHREQPAALMEQAIGQALQAGIAHLEGITFCLNRLLDPTPLVATLDLREHPTLANVGTQAVPLTQYNQLLGGDR